MSPNFDYDDDSQVGVFEYSWGRIAASIKAKIKAKYSEKCNASARNPMSFVTSHNKDDASSGDAISGSFFATVAMFTLAHIVFQ